MQPTASGIGSNADDRVVVLANGHQSVRRFARALYHQNGGLRRFEPSPQTGLTIFLH